MSMGEQDEVDWLYRDETVRIEMLAAEYASECSWNAAPARLDHDDVRARPGVSPRGHHGGDGARRACEGMEMSEPSTAELEAIVDALLPLDDACPWCCRSVEQWDEYTDGFATRCRKCGRRIVVVEWSDNMMSWERIERAPADPRTNRQRTMARRRKRGWK